MALSSAPLRHLALFAALLAAVALGLPRDAMAQLPGAGATAYGYKFATNPDQAFWKLGADTCTIFLNADAIPDAFNRTLARETYSGDGLNPRPAYVYKDFVEMTYPGLPGRTGRYLLDLVFPGYLQAETPQSITARLYAGFNTTYPPMRGREVLQTLLVDARGKVLVDLWDNAAAAIKADSNGNSTVNASAVESAVHAIDNSWAIWLGRPDIPCPSAMAPIVHYHALLMGGLSPCAASDNCPDGMGSVINLKLAAAHTAAVAAIRARNKPGFRRARATMLEAQLEFALLYTLFVSYSNDYAKQCNSPEVPPIPLRPWLVNITKQSMRITIPQTLSFARGLNPTNTLSARSAALRRFVDVTLGTDANNYTEVGAAVLNLANALQGVNVTSLGLPQVNLIHGQWGITNGTSCYDNGGSVPCPCWPGRRSCTC